MCRLSEWEPCGDGRVGTTCGCCVSLAREEGPAWPGPLERPSRCRRLFAVAEAKGPSRLQQNRRAGVSFGFTQQSILFLGFL